jgi:putative DNA primase/helicase
MDTYLEGRGELVGILNSGQTREMATVPPSRPDRFDPEHLSTWSPKVLAKIGALPPTIEDRS